MSLFNVCQVINCPYFRSEVSFGCQFYGSALHCHLIHPGDGIHKDGFESTTEYCVYANSVEGLKRLNENYLRNNARYVRDAKLKKSNPDFVKYPNRIL